MEKLFECGRADVYTLADVLVDQQNKQKPRLY